MTASNGKSEHGLTCGCVRCQGFAKGNEFALRHGGFSPRRIAASARNHRRRFLRGYRISYADLDGVARERMHDWSFCAARRDLVPPDSGASWTAVNSTRKALDRLEARLRELGLVDGHVTRDPAAALRRHVEEKAK
jgi:hypothetical protein